MALWQWAWEQPGQVLCIPDFEIQNLCLALFIHWSILQNALGSWFPSLSRLGTDLETLSHPALALGLSGQQENR